MPCAIYYEKEGDTTLSFQVKIILEHPKKTVSLIVVRSLEHPSQSILIIVLDVEMQLTVCFNKNTVGKSSIMLSFPKNPS